MDAETLLNGGRWSAAYYLLGYAVECGLKACVARQFHEHEVPEKTLVLDFYTHPLERLLNVAGLKAAMIAQWSADPMLEHNWNLVCNWNEASRYDPGTTESAAREMYAAVAHPNSGVLTWLKTQW